MISTKYCVGRIYEDGEFRKVGPYMTTLAEAQQIAQDLNNDYNILRKPFLVATVTTEIHIKQAID